MGYPTLCEALKMNELRGSGKYSFLFFSPLVSRFHSVKQCECTEQVKTSQFLLFKCCHGNLFCTFKLWRDCYSRLV